MQTNYVWIKLRKNFFVLYNSMQYNENSARQFIVESDFNRWLHRLLLFYHLNQWQCIYYPMKCHSLKLMMILLTIFKEVKTKLSIRLFRLIIVKNFINTWNMEAPYGVRHALSKLSFPVDTNHFPQLENFNDKTQLSCKCSWYLSGLFTFNTSTLELSILFSNEREIQWKNKLKSDYHEIKVFSFYFNEWQHTRQLTIHQLDRILMRKFVNWNHIDAIVVLHEDPNDERYYRGHQSIICCHQR